MPQLWLLFTALMLSNHYAQAKDVSSLLQSYRFDESWIFRDYSKKYNPIPIKDTQDNIIYVSGTFAANSTIQLDFEDPKKTCIVPQTLTYNSVSRRNAYSLGNGKVVVTYLNNRVSHRNFLSRVFNVEWRLTIVDPKICSHYNLVVAKAGDLLVDVLPYEDNFDVLIRNMNKKRGPKTTKVLRYNDKGELIKRYSATIPVEDCLYVFMNKEFDPSKGYYCIISLQKSGVSIFKKLNSNFQLMKSFKFNHSKYWTCDLNAYSVGHGRFSICYFNEENGRSMDCLIVDDELNNVLTDVHINYEHEIHYVTVKNLPEKRGILIIYSKCNKDSSSTVYVQHVSEDGIVNEPVELGTVPNSIYYDYIFEKKNGSYCVSISISDSIATKCINKI